MQELILTFYHTHGSILGEQTLLAAGIAVKVMPVPGAISAGCGLCLRIPAAELEAGLDALKQAGCDTQAVYRMENGNYTQQILKV